VTEQEFAALPPEYDHEPALGLKAGADGLDFALRILAEAPAHLSEDGTLIVEVGESEHALTRLLPKLPLNWIEFAVGQMGVFAIARSDIAKHGKAIKAALAKRK
jgi:ribosomal protein L3 glutamine methyltransferase